MDDGRPCVNPHGPEDHARATRGSWNFRGMPERRIVTTYRRVFSEEELWNLDRGHIACDMDDRWCFYVEDGWASIHRSWTGNCIFMLELGRGPEHRLIINSDLDEYTGGIGASLEILDGLLDRWSDADR